MIVVKLNRADFEYDIHSLVKAFYPSETVKIIATETETPQEISTNDDQPDTKSDAVSYSLCVEDENDILFEIDIKYGTDTISIDETKINVTMSDRKDTKNKLKEALYLMLSAKTGKELPWGTQTGIRPTKIPLELLENGTSEEEIKDLMKHVYLTSEEKIALSLVVARKEKSILEQMDYKNGYSLYVGIPFCPSTCLYCSFTSYPASLWKDRMEEYISCLEKEIAFVAAHSKDKILNTIYIGGGTPTTLEPELMDRLLTALETAFDISTLSEFTVEAGRPDSITAEKLAVIKKHAVTRISINPQTMKDETLKLIGRHHNVAQTVESFQLAREMGFDNINMDLIVGLPEETKEDVAQTLKQIEQLAPDSITVHSLALKRAARLNIEKENYKEMHFINTQDILDMTAERAAQMGMAPYYLYRQKNMAGNFENVGYASAGKEGIYNILIMEDKQPIIAIGAGAMTKFVATDGSGLIDRVQNVKDVKNYLERIDEMIERKKKKMEELSWH